MYKARDRSTGRLVALKKTRLEVRVSFSRAFARRARRRRPRSGRRCRGFFCSKPRAMVFIAGGTAARCARSRGRASRASRLSRDARPLRVHEGSARLRYPRTRSNRARRGRFRGEATREKKARPTRALTRPHPPPRPPRAIRWRKRASRPRRCARFPSCRCSARARSSSGARRSIVRSIARGPRAARSASVAPSASPRRQRIHARAVPFFKPSSVALFPRVPVHRAHRPSPPRARPPLASSSRPRTQAPESRARRGGRQGDALPRL